MKRFGEGGKRPGYLAISVVKVDRAQVLVGTCSGPKDTCETGTLAALVVVPGLSGQVTSQLSLQTDRGWFPFRGGALSSAVPFSFRDLYTHPEPFQSQVEEHVSELDRRHQRNALETMTTQGT